MLNKKILFGTFFAAAILLTSCKKETELIDDFTTTAKAVSETNQSDAVVIEGTTAEKSDGLPDIVLNADGGDEEDELAARKEEQRETEEYFAEHGFELSVNMELSVDMADFPDIADPLADIDKQYLERVLGVRLTNCAERNFDFLTGVKNLKAIVFEDAPGDADINFLADCENLYSVWFRDYSGSMEKLTEAVKNSGVKNLTVDPAEYTLGGADVVMRAAPSCEVQYRMDSAYDNSREGLMVYTNMLVSSSEESKSLSCTFTNFTDEDKTVTAVRIFKWDGTELPFADGNTVYNTELAVKAGESADFEISEDIFPFTACETGVYKIEFDCGGEKLQQIFAVDNSGSAYENVEQDMGIWEYRTLYGARQADDETYSLKVPGFLNEEQREAYKEAFVITSMCFGSSGHLPETYFEDHTEEEFYDVYCKGYTRDHARSKLEYYGFLDKNGKLRANDWDGGSDISYRYSLFVPLYSDENEIFFKCVSVHSYDDEEPYSVWFEEESFHMINTEDGWKFDSFSYLG